MLARLALSGAALALPFAADGLPMHASGPCDGRATVPQATQQLRKNKDDAMTFVCRARAYTETRNYARALSDLDQAAHLSPTDGDVLAERARVHVLRRDDKSALTDYNRAAALHLTTRVLRERSAVHSRLGDRAAAMADLDTAIRLQPTSSQLYVLRGQLRAQTATAAVEATASGPVLAKQAPPRATAQAIEDFLFALQLDSSDARAYLGLAQAQRDMARDDLRDASAERFADAIANADAAIRHGPEMIEAWLLKAQLLAQGDDEFNARRLLSQVLEKFPGRAEPFAVRGRISLEARFLTAAIDDATTAIGLEKTFATPFCVRASALLEMGKRAPALRDFEQCLLLAKDAETRAWASHELDALSIPTDIKDKARISVN
jgi:tetratricopeptide (TPR) repeat protein